MKLDGYIRVSRVNGREGESFISPELQRDAIQRWTDANGHEIADDAWHEELDRSGGRGKKRPVFEALLKRVIAGESDGIVVWKLSRFGRSALDAGLAIRQIEDAGGTVESATEGTQTKLVRALLLGIAEDEHDRIREGWANAQQRAVDRGLWIGRTPIGYRISVIGYTKKGDPINGPLEPDPEEGPIVSEAFRLAASQGFRAAMRHLEREFEHRRWRVDETRRVLSNRLYLGEITVGKQQVLKNPASHPPLTTLDRFEAAQALPEMTKRPQRSKGKYPLSGIARCGVCGSPIIGSLQGVKNTAGEVQYYRRMRCSDQKCGRCSISADQLEALVKDRIGVVLGAKAIRLRQDGGELDAAQEALALADSDLTRWTTDDRARDLIGDEAWYQGIAERAARVEEARERYRLEAARVNQSTVIPALSELDRPGQFELAAKVIVKKIVIAPGRAPVRDRATIEWSDEVELPAAEAGSPFYENASEQAIETTLDVLAATHRR